MVGRATWEMRHGPNGQPPARPGQPQTGTQGQGLNSMHSVTRGTTFSRFFMPMIIEAARRGGAVLPAGAAEGWTAPAVWQQHVPQWNSYVDTLLAVYRAQLSSTEWIMQHRDNAQGARL